MNRLQHEHTCMTIYFPCDIIITGKYVMILSSHIDDWQGNRKAQNAAQLFITRVSGRYGMAEMFHDHVTHSKGRPKNGSFD